MWHIFPVLIIDTHFIKHCFSIYLSLKATVDKRSTVSFDSQDGTLVARHVQHNTRQPTRHQTFTLLENSQRRLQTSRSFPCHTQRPLRVAEQISPVSPSEIKLAWTEQLWSWHVLHPDGVTKGFLHPNRGMLLCGSFAFELFLHVSSDFSLKLD